MPPYEKDSVFEGFNFFGIQVSHKNRDVSFQKIRADNHKQKADFNGFYLHGNAGAAVLENRAMAPGIEEEQRVDSCPGAVGLLIAADCEQALLKKERTGDQ